MDELKTTFLNENGREYTVRVTVPIAHAFCRMHAIKLEGLNPLLLDIAQILDLAYMASRSSKLTALGETKEQFLDGLEGQAFTLAQESTVNALVNFSLRILPKEQAEILRREVEKAQGAKASHDQEGSQSQESPGNGVT